MEKKTHKNTILVLLVGVVLGGGIGFFIGQTTGSRPIIYSKIPSLHSDNDSLEDKSISISNIHRLDVTIADSLYKTLANALENRTADLLCAHIGRVLVWWVNVRKDLLKGDRICVVYEETDNAEEIQILGIEFTSQKLNKTFTAYYFQAQGSTYGRFYNSNGEEVELRLVNGPFKDYEQVTELVNLSRQRGQRHHKGIDFKADVGTPIKTPFQARVVRCNWKWRYNGNCVELIYLPSGVHALFLHLDKVPKTTKPGIVLAKGTVFAYSGNTGHVTAPHLHYELHGVNGRVLDPFNFHTTTRIKLPQDQITAFQSLMYSIEKKLHGN